MTQSTSTLGLVGEAVGHLSDYYKHVSTLAGGAIAFVATFSGDLLAAGGIGWIAVIALIALGACVGCSTGMMWAYGVARRQVASEELGPTGASWAFRATPKQLRRAEWLTSWLPTATPIAFVSGFLLLGVYAIALVMFPPLA